MPRKPSVKVIQPSEKEQRISVEILATAIRDMSKTGQALKDSSLSERAIVVLIQDMTGVNQAVIRQVLEALPLLEKRYCK